MCENESCILFSLSISLPFIALICEIMCWGLYYWHNKQVRRNTLNSELLIKKINKYANNSDPHRCIWLHDKFFDPPKQSKHRRPWNAKNVVYSLEFSWFNVSFMSTGNKWFSQFIFIAIGSLVWNFFCSS